MRDDADGELEDEDGGGAGDNDERVGGDDDEVVVRRAVAQFKADPRVLAIAAAKRRERLGTRLLIPHGSPSHDGLSI